jgi:fatty acid desaturase
LRHTNYFLNLVISLLKIQYKYFKYGCRFNKWFSPCIDKKEFKKLCKKSDWQGFKHMIIYFSFLGFFGYLAFATWGTWWSLLFFIIYGNIWGCSDAIWHETGHRTAFKSKFWNDFFYYIASFMDNFEPIRWRYSHYHHHTYTIFNDPVDFEIHVKKPTDLLIFFTHYIPFSGFIFFKNSLQWETIKACIWCNNRSNESMYS